MQSSRTLADLKGNISERTIDLLSLIVITFCIVEVMEGDGIRHCLEIMP